MPSRPVLVCALPVALILFLLIGCGQVSPGSSIAPDPGVLKDTSPGQLTALVSIFIGGYDATTRNTTTIHISFESGEQIVKFVAGE